MYHLTEAYLMAATISSLAALLGALLGGAALVAPVAKRLADRNAAASFLAAYWQRYHALAVLTGLTLTLVGAATLPFSALPAVYSSLLIALSGLMTTCFIVGMRLLPPSSGLPDAQASVQLPMPVAILIGAGLLTGLLLLVALIYVLPGQFTFWPSHMESHQ